MHGGHMHGVHMHRGGGHMNLRMASVMNMKKERNYEIKYKFVHWGKRRESLIFVILEFE